MLQEIDGIRFLKEPFNSLKNLIAEWSDKDNLLSFTAFEKDRRMIMVRTPRAVEGPGREEFLQQAVTLFLRHLLLPPESEEQVTAANVDWEQPTVTLGSAKIFAFAIMSQACKNRRHVLFVCYIEYIRIV